MASLDMQPTQSTLIPTLVQDLPQNIYLVSYECHFLRWGCVVMTHGEWRRVGLGLCPDASRAATDSGDAISPLLLLCKPYQPKFPDPVQVACGAAHTVIAAQEVWSWGRGRSGVLGNGKEMDCYTPTMVMSPPATEVSKEEESKSSDEQDKETKETDEKLSSALNELKLLQAKLSTMERYASILHGCVFGKPLDAQDIPAYLRVRGFFDIAKEWESMLEAAHHRTLVR